jgi:hypothetical protein
VSEGKMRGRGGGGGDSGAQNAQPWVITACTELACTKAGRVCGAGAGLGAVRPSAISLPSLRPLPPPPHTDSKGAGRLPNSLPKLDPNAPSTASPAPPRRRPLPPPTASRAPHPLAPRRARARPPCTTPPAKATWRSSRCCWRKTPRR